MIRPQTLSPDAGAVPASLRPLPQWLLWRFESYEGDKKPRKVPYYVSGRKRRGVQGSDEDREQLATFDDAAARLAAGGFDGIGFAFLPGDGLVGIDIDGAIDDDGQVSERCQAIIEACGSFTELSPSGRGVHIICTGATETFKDNRIGLEVFCGRQFFTVTGRRWAGTPDDVQPLADDTLRRLRATVKGARARSTGERDLAEPTPGAPGSHVTRYCLAALESAVQRLRGTGEGGRNHALNAEAFGLAQLVHSGGVSEATIRAALGDVARSIGLTDAEVKATLDSAVRAGLAAPRTLPAPKAMPGGRQKAAGGRSTPWSGSAEGGGGNGAPPPDDPPEAEGEDWRRRLIRERGGKKDCRENVCILLQYRAELKGLVGYDDFAHLVVKLRPPPWDSDPGEWTVHDDYNLGMWLSQHERLVVRSEATLVAGVAMAAYAARFNPLLDYLNGLPAWDGIERLPFWLSECLGADESDYTRAVGTWFLMGMVKRALEPGCQMDYMVVLEGLQGKRKSTALRTLVGRDEWFADTPIRVGDKDAMLSLAGKWLTEIGELDSFNKAEVTAVKQYITSRVDRVREPFARRHADRRRSCVFAGTTNQSEYFKDPTGARRFWPVACDGEIDVEKLADWRDRLYAEALHRLRSDDQDVRRYYPTREETERLLVPQQDRREIADPWFERLALWLNSDANYGEAGLVVREVQSFTSYELLSKCLQVPPDRIDGNRQMATRVGIALHRLGWVKRRDGGSGRGWRYTRPQAEDRGSTGAAGGPGASGGDGHHEALDAMPG